VRGSFVLAGIVMFLVSGCGGQGTDPVTEEPDFVLHADQVMFKIRHHMTNGGVRRALLQADTAYLHEASATVDLRRVHLTLYDEHGQERAVLTSLEGRMNTRTEAMTATGEAVLVTDGGSRRIESDELHFDPEQDRIWSERPTTMYENGNVVHGVGFTSDGQMRNVRVQRPTGRFEDLRMDF
jgi:LPS export ABC transporter protein LptC